MFSFRSREVFDMMIAADYDPLTYEPPAEEEVRTREDMIYDEPARRQYSCEFKVERKAAKKARKKEATLVQENFDREPSPTRSESGELSDIQPVPITKVQNPKTKWRNEQRKTAKKRKSIENAAKRDLVRGAREMVQSELPTTKVVLASRGLSESSQSPKESQDNHLFALEERKHWLGSNSDTERKSLTQSFSGEPDAKESITHPSSKGAVIRTQSASIKDLIRTEDLKLMQRPFDTTPNFHNGPGVTLPGSHQRKVRRWAEKHHIDRYVTPGASVSEAFYDKFYFHPRAFSPTRDGLMRSSRERSHLALKPQASRVYGVDSIRRDLTDVERWAKLRNVDRWVPSGAPVTSSCFDDFYLQPQEFSTSRDDLKCSSHARQFSTPRSRENRRPPRTEPKSNRHRENSSLIDSQKSISTRNLGNPQDDFLDPIPVPGPGRSQPTIPPSKQIQTTTLEEVGAIVYVNAGEAK